MAEDVPLNDEAAGFGHQFILSELEIELWEEKESCQILLYESLIIFVIETVVKVTLRESRWEMLYVAGDATLSVVQLDDKLLKALVEFFNQLLELLVKDDPLLLDENLI